MKNFTKQDFKTNPLWVRLLIMTFMLLAGVIEIYGTTVYFVNKPKWSQVNVHNWNGGTGTNWPGTKATKESYQVEGYDVYICDIGNNKNFIFSNNGSNQTGDLHIDNGTWYYDGKQYSSKEAIEGTINNSHNTHTSITKFSVSSSDVIYFDATGTGWTTCYMYIGHNNYSKRFAMTRVAGTKNLWKGTSFGSWSDAQAWYFSSEDWNDIANGKNECILCKACYHTENTFLMPYKSDFTNNAIYKASANNQMYATSECYKNAWSWSTTVDTYSSSLSVSITNKVGTNNTANAGTVTVKKWNSTTSSAGTAYNTSFLSTSAATGSDNTGYLTALRVTLTPASGYQLEKLVVGSTDVTSSYNTNKYYDIEVTAATTIVATWKQDNPSYTITYKDQGNVAFSGTHASGYPTTHTYGTATTLKTATKTGYTFGGWFTSSDCSGTAVTTLGATAYTANITLYAKWTPSQYTITYKDKGNVTFSGTHASGYPTKHTYGTTTTLKTATKTGYTFGGWFTSSDCSGTAVTTLGATAYTANITLYAKWTPNQYTITYKDQGGANFSGTHASGNPTKHTYGTATTLKTASKTGYTFGGWFTTSDCTGNAVTSLGATAYSANITLYAKWIANQYTITYKDQGNLTFSGTHANGYPTTHTYGTATELKTATKAGYTFGGWFTNSACTGNAVTSLGATDYTSAITLYAKWTEVCEPIAGLYWEITSGEKDKYCPGDVVSVRITYKGSTAKEYQWGGEWSGNIGIKGGSLASGAVYTMTINKPGTVNLTLKGCDGVPATTSTLEFTTHEAPATPTVSFTVNPVGQSKETILSIASYSADNNYIVYRSADNAVGNDTEVGTYTVPMSIRHNDTGSYYYYAKATNKSCANLTATSAIVKLDVQEAGAIIAALGDLKVDPQDPVDFVAMYVKNDGLADYTDQGATKVTGYTWEFSSDGGNIWTPCVSTATIGVTNGSDKCNNFRPSAEGKYRCKVTYDKGEQTSNVLTVTGDGSTARTFKGVTMNIPVISVNTGKEKFPTCDGLSGTASKNADVIKEKISVDVKIFNADGTVYYDRKARMNYRGSSSLNFVKKSYAFCTAKEKTKDDKGAVDTGKENLFGLSNGAKDKDWVLYAAAADPSIMRNRLMFDTFRDMTGGWSVNSMYVELVVNGEYKGVYVLMDKITANEKRVNVSWNLDKQGNTTQEGFIVKFDKTDIVDRYENTSGDQKTFKSTYSGHDGFTTYDTQIDQRFEIEYPEKEDIEEEDLEKGQQAGDWSVVFNSIKDKFNKFEKELKDGNFSEVQKIIDYQSWADWFIITEFGKNIDGYRASNLFVYDGSKPNAKIEARPLWDQELSFDNHCPNYYASYGANSEERFIVENSEGFNNDASTPFWFTGKYKGGRGTYNGSNQTFKGLLDDPCFVAMVKTRWETHKANALSESKLNAKLEAYTTEMGAAKDREAAFWSTRSRGTCQCSYSGSTGYDDVSFTDSKKAITDWIGKRPAGLTTAINELKGLDLTISLTVTPDGGVTTPWEAVMVKVNNPSGYDYDLNYTTNTLDKVEGVIINENNDKYTYRIPRPSTWGTGDGERTAIEYGIEATLLVGEEGSQCGNEIGDELTKASTVITLKDEENDNCTELTD